LSHSEFNFERPQTSLLKRGLTIILSFMLAATAMFVTAPGANAAPGVTTTVLQNGSVMQPGAEVYTGDSLQLQVKYTAAAVGQEVEVKLGPGVNVSHTFPDNEAVESFTPTADGVLIKFKDPWPDIAQGILNLDLVMEPVDETAPGQVTWNDGTDHSVPVVFMKDGDSKQDVGDGFAKAVSPGNLDSYVDKDADGNYIGVKDGIEDEILTYTLTINTPEGVTRPAGFTVSDELLSGLG